MDSAPAEEAAKNQLENNVNWYLADKLAEVGTTIATKKFITPDNVLVYLTRCNMSEAAIPVIKVQVFQRIDGGVHERSYQLYTDHRLERTDNEMIFGDAANGADGSIASPVTAAEANELLTLITSLQQARAGA